MDMNKMDKIRVDDLKLRPEVYATRLAAPCPIAGDDQQRDAAN